MESNERPAGDGVREAARPRSHLFTIRLWKEEVANGLEFRGSVREVISGANHNFRDWSDLTSFMIEQIEEDEKARSGQTKRGT